VRYELPAGGGNAPSNPREVQMRKWVSAVIAFVALVVGYSFAPGSAGAQSPSVPFVPGQRLLLTFESGRNQQPCIVITVQGDFIGCMRERSIGAEEREFWYNLRFVERIEKRER
jgi:hypothetical protein